MKLIGLMRALELDRPTWRVRIFVDVYITLDVIIGQMANAIPNIFHFFEDKTWGICGTCDSRCPQSSSYFLSRQLTSLIAFFF